MPNLRIHGSILLCLVLTACTCPWAKKTHVNPPKHQKTENVPPHHVPAKKGPTPAPKVASPVIGSPVKAGVANRPEDVQAVVKAAGDNLRQLSKEQAQGALNELKPGTSTDNPQEEITEMLIDTTTMDQALQILKTLQRSKQE
jgi:hypothetical protein